MHPLADVITAAAAGRFPPADGAVVTLPPWRPRLEAVVASLRCLLAAGFTPVGSAQVWHR